MKYSPDLINSRLNKSDLFTERNSIDEINQLIQNWIALGGGVKGEVWSFKITHSHLRLRLYARRGGIEESLIILCAWSESFSGNTAWENSELDISAVPNEDRQYLVTDKAGDLRLICGAVCVMVADLEALSRE